MSHHRWLLWGWVRHWRLASRLLVLLSLYAFPAEHQTAADTFTWTGASPNIIGIANNWSNPLNWQDGLIPVNDGTADVVIPDTPRDNPEVNMAWSISSLTFEGAGNYNLDGDPLTLNDLGHNGTGTVTIENALALTESAAWHTSGGPMTLSGAISGADSLGIFAPQPITFDGSAANTLSGTVLVADGTLILSKSSFSGAIAGNLSIDDATVRWDAPDQVSDLPNSQVIVRNNAVADLNGNDETLAQLILVTGGKVESTGGRLTVTGQLGMQDSTEVDLGSGELRLEAAVIRGGSSADMSRISANVITLNQTQSLFSATDSPADVELEVAGQITGAFAGAFLQKTGTGTLRLIGANTYQGGTTISTGTLIVDNTTGSGTGTGTVSVQTGATLTGDGSIAGPVAMQNGATITPAVGGAIGSLDVGGLSMNTTSIAHFQINEGLPFIHNDRLEVENVASINGNLVLENLNFDVLPDPSAIYTILTSSTLTGAFANAANGARLDTIDGSGSFVVNYGAGSSFNPNSIVLSDFLSAGGLPGDYNDDGIVNAADYVVWRNNEGTANALPNDPIGGTVGAAQYAQWRDNFGSTSASGSFTPPSSLGSSHSAVPEPAAGTLLLIAAAWLAVAQRWISPFSFRSADIAASVSGRRASRARTT